MRMIRRLLLDRRGSYALEIGFIGPPFLLLMLAIVELGLVLFTQTLLDGAARDAARLIRTGQVQTGSSQAAQFATFQNLLCSDLSILLSQSDCQSQVVIEVVSQADFASTLTFPPCAQNVNSTTQGTTCQFASTIPPKQVVGVQVSYNRKSLISWVGQYLTPVGTNGTGTGFTLLMSTVVFLTEPY